MPDSFFRREPLALITALPLGITAVSSMASPADDSGGTKAKLREGSSC
jgi:hypothetical protein